MSAKNGILHSPRKTPLRSRLARVEIDSCAAQKEAIRAGKIRFYGLTHGHYPGTELPPELLPGLRNLGFWDAVGQQDWRMEPHLNDGLEIVFLETGRMDFSVGRTAAPLLPGMLTVTLPWQMHCHGPSHVGPGRLHWMILDIGALTADETWQWPDFMMLTHEDLVKLEALLRDVTVPVFPALPEIAESFRKLADCLTASDPAERASQIAVSINQILVGLLAAVRSEEIKTAPPDTGAEQAVHAFLERLHMDPSLLGEPWSLETMARKCGVGCTSLAKHCKQLTNTSPMDYLNRCRLEWAARELLRHPEKTITDIAFLAGFASSPYFSTQFHRRYSMSPRNYRRKNLC